MQRKTHKNGRSMPRRGIQADLGRMCFGYRFDNAKPQTRPFSGPSLIGPKKTRKNFAQELWLDPNSIVHDLDDRFIYPCAENETWPLNARRGAG